MQFVGLKQVLVENAEKGEKLKTRPYWSQYETNDPATPTPCATSKKLNLCNNFIKQAKNGQRNTKLWYLIIIYFK